MDLPIKPLTSSAKLPTYAHDSDAGMDLYADENLTIQAETRAIVKTGIALAIPEGFVGLIWDKSSVATKTGLLAIAGVIDAGYRGEILVALHNSSHTDVTIKAGQKIAQLLIQPVLQPHLVVVDNLNDTTRGANGFGSTGV